MNDYNDYNNIKDLIKLKKEIIKLNEELKKLASKIAMKEKRINNIRLECDDGVLVKLSDEYNNDNNNNYEYYCLFCEKKIDNFVNNGNQAVIDFSCFTLDECNLTISDKIDISFELYLSLKKANPLIPDEKIVNAINISIKEVDETVQEKVMRKLFESLGVFSRRRV